MLLQFSKSVSPCFFAWLSFRLLVANDVTDENHPASDVSLGEDASAFGGFEK